MIEESAHAHGCPCVAGVFSLEDGVLLMADIWFFALALQSLLRQE